MRQSRQLALAFPEQRDFPAADFLEAGSNAEARAWLRRTPDWPGGRLVIWGEAGCGKTHLLHLWAAARWVPVLAGPALRLDAGSPPGQALAVDDADAAPEEALLHLLNAAQEAWMPVLMAAQAAPTDWPVRLADLASRVRAASAVAIQPAEETLLRALFARLLSARQLAVAADVQDWLLLRLPRTPAALREVAARLDRATLASQTGVTRALAARVLAELGSAGSRQTDEMLLPSGLPGSSEGAALL